MLIIYILLCIENDERGHFVVHIGSPSLISFYCVCFLSFCFSYFFLSFFLGVLLLDEVIRKVWRYLECDNGFVPRFLSRVSMGDFPQLYLVINVTDLVERTDPS